MGIRLGCLRAQNQSVRAMCGQEKKGLNGNPAKSLILLARPQGFEPRAYGLEVR